MNAVLHVFSIPAQTIAMFLINALWEDALILIAMTLLIRFWPRLNASTRYAISLVGLFAALAAPVATTLAAPVASTLAAPVASTLSAHGSANLVIPSLSREAHQSTARRLTLTPAGHDVATTRGASFDKLGMTTAQLGMTTAQLRMSEGRPTVLRPQVPISAQVALGIASLWIVVSLVALVRLTTGLVRLEGLKRNALPLPLEYRDMLFRCHANGRDVRFCVSDETEVPIAVGLFDSMVLIPNHLLESLSSGELEQVCLHECAHLRRADDWTNLLQRVLTAVLCFSPAIYAMTRGLDLEREVACDDDVITETGAVRPYAQCLTRMAEVTAWPHHALAAPGVFVTRRGISERIERLLRAGKSAARGLSLGPAATALALLAVLTFGMCLVAPTVAAPAAARAVAPSTTRTTHGAMLSVRRQVALAPTPAATAPPRVISVPAHHVHIPAKHVYIPPKHIHVRGYDVNVPPVHVNVPAVHVHVPPVDVNVPGVTVNVPAVNVDVPAMSFTVPDYYGDRHSPSCTAGCDFADVSWAGRNLSGRSYEATDFSDAELSGADFSHDLLKAVDFSNADLRNANFTGARLTYVNFSDARLSGARFDGASIGVCDFSDVDMTHVDLSRAKLASICRLSLSNR